MSNRQPSKLSQSMLRNDQKVANVLDLGSILQASPFALPIDHEVNMLECVSS